MTRASLSHLAVRWFCFGFVLPCFGLACSVADGAPGKKRSVKAKNASSRRASTNQRPEKKNPVLLRARTEKRPTRTVASAHPDQVARVVSVNGRALRAGKPLKPGDAITEGETIQTEPSSGVKLLLPEQTVVDAGASTHLSLATTPNLDSPNHPHSEVRLDFGTVRASIQKKLDKKSKFLIRTKSSVLSARGTEFFVRSLREGNAVREQFVVGDGQVDVTPLQGQKFTLNPGQQATGFGQLVGGEFRAPAASSFQTQNLSGAQTQETLRTATVVDQTFQQAIVLSRNPAEGTFGGQNTLAAVIPAITKPQIKRDESSIALITPPELGRLREFAGSQAEQRLKGVKVTILFEPGNS